MSHSINKAITLHFLISDAIRNNHLYQRFLTVQEANLSGLSHVFTGNSLEAQVVSVSPPPVQLSSLEPPANIRPGGRSLSVPHQQNGDRMA